MSKKSDIAFFSLLVLILVTADQFLKRIITYTMELYDQHYIIDNFFSFKFSIDYVVNTGSAFSFLADKSWGIYVLSIVSMILGSIIMLFTLVAAGMGKKFLASSFALISAGAFGNLVDRFTLKHVIDFLRFDFGSYTFPVFNFADICAVVGTLLIIFLILFKPKYFDEFLRKIGVGAKKHA